MNSLTVAYAFIVSLFLCVHATRTYSSCPCSDPSLCEPIANTTRREIFIFSLRNHKEIWTNYDWTKVTTVVMFGYISPDLMCWAHKHGARAVALANFPKSQFTNTTARSEWVTKQVSIVQENFLDGINVDFEDAIYQNETADRQGYTWLIQELYSALKKANPIYQLTVDVAWSPGGIDSRYYDYKRIADATDFIFVMAYDEQSQIRGPCIAGANSAVYNALKGCMPLEPDLCPRTSIFISDTNTVSDYSSKAYTFHQNGAVFYCQKVIFEEITTMEGVEGYLKLGIPSDKMVFGVPWYGYLYTCLLLTADDTCYIKHVPFRGVNCSDAAGSEINYSSMVSYLLNSPRGVQWNQTTETPYFNFKVDNTTYQVQFDNPRSLQIKFKMLEQFHLRGFGMWNADALNYINKTSETLKERKEMWGSFPNL